MSASPAVIATIKTLESSGALTQDVIEAFRKSGDLTVSEARQLSKRVADATADVKAATADVKAATAKLSEPPVKLPKMPPAVKVALANGSRYSIEGETHWGRPGERKVRAVPVVVVQRVGAKVKPLTITADLLAIIDAKRAEIDAHLAYSRDSIDALRGAKVSLSEASADDSEFETIS